MKRFVIAIALGFALGGALPAAAEQGVPNSAKEYRTWATKGPYRSLFRSEVASVQRDAKAVAQAVESYMMKCVHGRATGLQQVHGGIFGTHKGKVIDHSVYTVKTEKSGTVRSVYGLKARLVRKKPVVLFEPLVDIVPDGAGKTKLRIIRQINNGGIARQIKAAAAGKPTKCVGLAL